MTWNMKDLREAIHDLNSIMGNTHDSVYKELNELIPLDRELYNEILKEIQAEEDSWWRGQTWRQTWNGLEIFTEDGQ